MSNVFDDVGAPAKKEMVLFFVIDRSGSMSGTKMGAVNTAIREVLPELKGIGGSDAIIKIAVLLFSSGVDWMYAEPISVNDFQWNSVEAFGLTEFGAACTELGEKMSRSAFLNAASASVAPAIFLMSDGQPTDAYKKGLEKLQGNRWFKNAIRIAVAIGDDADANVLAEFAGNSEAVIRVHTPEALKKMIRFVSVTSSQIGSVSQPIFEDSAVTLKQDSMVQAIQDMQTDADFTDAAADDWD